MKGFKFHQSNLENNSLFNSKPVKILKQKCENQKFDFFRRPIVLALLWSLLDIVSENVRFSTTARNIGIIFSNSLSMVPHVTVVRKSSFRHLYIQKEYYLSISVFRNFRNCARSRSQSPSVLCSSSGTAIWRQGSVASVFSVFFGD